MKLFPALLILTAVLALSIPFAVSSRSNAMSSAEMIGRGKYLVQFGACNDCHTPGWREGFGDVPLAKWMTGSSIGFRGPWGTVYPTNVRQRFFEITENQWLSEIQLREGHPPMTWHDLRGLTLDDRRAIYRFVRSLGKAGPPSLPDVPPDVTPKTPYITIVQP